MKKRILEGCTLTPLVHNALRTEEDAQGFLHFSRFTSWQLERYAAAGRRLDYDFMPKTRPASGVTLDFVTDSASLALRFRWEPVMLPYLRLDLLVDGILWDSLYSEDASTGLAAFRLPEGRHRITLVLPWSAEFFLKSLALEGNASLESVNAGLGPDRSGEAPEFRKSLRILAFGDSITQGYYAAHPSLSYAAGMTRELNAECLNQGIGAFLFDRSVLDPALRDWKPDLITVAYGTNDYGFRDSAEEYREGAAGFTEELTGLFPKTRILGILPIFRSDNCFLARRFIKAYEPEEAWDALRGVYGQYPQITVLEGGFFPHDADCFSPDLLHPNDLGFQFYTRAVVNSLRSLLH